MFIEVIERRAVQSFNEMIYYMLCKTDDSYSVSIFKDKDMAEVEGFTVNKIYAYYVFYRLTGGIVYPVHLKDVVEDLLADYDPKKYYGDCYEEKSGHTQQAQDQVKT